MSRDSDSPKVGTTGIVYCATGRYHSRLAIYSIQKLREVESARIELFTDRQSYSKLKMQLSREKVQVRVLDKPTFSFEDKIQSLLLTGFKKLVFLDSDTVPLTSFLADFNLALENSDLIALPNMELNLDEEAEIFPPIVGQFNTGVLGMNRVECESVLRDWLKIYREQLSEPHDQPSFRAAVIRNSPRFAPLSQHYNFMGSGFAGPPGSLHYPRIIHIVQELRLGSAGEALKKMALHEERVRKLTKVTLLRGFADSPGSGAGIKTGQVKSRVSPLITCYRKRGLFGCVRRLAQLTGKKFKVRSHRQ